MWIGYLLTFALLLYVHIWLHEIGHAVAGRAVGYEVTSLGTGWGKPLFSWSWRGVRFFVCRDNFFSGVAFVFPDKKGLTRRAKVFMHGGGVIANFLTASVIALILHFVSDNVILWTAFGIACWLVVGNLIPQRNLRWSYASQTDGATIIDTLWPRKSSGVSSTNDWLQKRQILVRFLQDVGDERGAYRCGAYVVPALLACGDVDAAKVLVTRMASVGTRDPQRRSEYAFLRLDVASAVKDDPDYGSALEEAEAVHTGDRNDERWVTLRWHRFRWLLDAERPAEALEIIDELIAQYPIDKNAQMAVTLLTCRIHAVADLHGMGEGLKVRDEYLRQRSHHESPQLDLNVAHGVGHGYAKIGEWAAAEPYYREALALLITAGASSLAAKELIKDAQECFEHLELANDPVLVEAKNSLRRKDSDQQITARSDAHQDFLVRRNTEMALGCIFWNLLIFALAWRDGSQIDFGALLSKFSAAAVVAIIIAYAFGYVSREFRRFTAPVIVLLTALPWIGAWLIMRSL